MKWNYKHVYFFIILSRVFTTQGKIFTEVFTIFISFINLNDTVAKFSKFADVSKKRDVSDSFERF